MEAATAIAPPLRTLDQRMAALARANGIRSARAVLKKKLKSREVTIADLLLGDLPNCLETMRVFDLLVHCPKIGKVKANRMCTRNNIRPSMYLPRLSPSRRQTLVQEVEGRSRGTSSGC